MISSFVPLSPSSMFASVRSCATARRRTDSSKGCSLRVMTRDDGWWLTAARGHAEVNEL